MVLLTVAIHAAGLLGLTKYLRLHERDGTSPLSPEGIAVTFAVVIGLFALHGIEIWAYALLCLVLGALPDLETAVSFSTITYSTIGYDDEGMARHWSLVSAIEGINGVILLG